MLNMQTKISISIGECKSGEPSYVHLYAFRDRTSNLHQQGLYFDGRSSGLGSNLSHRAVTLLILTIERSLDRQVVKTRKR